jgi:phosphoribosylformylglycinamidine (FGAM) synthase-like enzyme
VGGDPTHTAILDNFSWGNCDKPHQLGALVLASEGCRDAALAFETPFISGKDSLNNEYRIGTESRSIPPTLLISALSIVPDVRLTLSMDLKSPGNLLFLVGQTRAELGGSEYFRACGLRGGRVPAPDLSSAPQQLKDLHLAIQAGLVASCHDLSEGGLAVAAGEMAFAGGFGLDLDLAQVSLQATPGADRDATALFSESCTRFLLEVTPEKRAALEEALSAHDLSLLGAVRSDTTLEIRSSNGEVLTQTPIADLRAAHHSFFQG